MDKAAPSRRHKQAFSRVYLGLLFLIALPSAATAITLSQADAKWIGKKIWQNECNGTISGLTSWNAGENFPSLGIGHFIWYPEGKRGPFEESFPKLVSFVSKRGAKLPPLLQEAEHSPWKSRSEFLHSQQTSEVKQLRQFLVDTIDLQAQFLVDRLQNALPKMLEEAAPSKQDHVRQQFQRVAGSRQGCYALVDYVNFKGEGVLDTERYHNQGWGLLQVLEGMRASAPDPVEEFSRSAKAILTRRVQNAPPERNESRWLPGWINRINSYSRG